MLYFSRFLLLILQMFCMTYQCFFFPNNLDSSISLVTHLNSLKILVASCCNSMISIEVVAYLQQHMVSIVSVIQELLLQSPSSKVCFFPCMVGGNLLPFFVIKAPLLCLTLLHAKNQPWRHHCPTVTANTLDVVPSATCS